MSIEYHIEVHRKCDDKIIAKFMANQLKTIMDSEFSDKIRCDGRQVDDSKFTTDDLETVISLAKTKIKNDYAEIFSNKLMLMNAGEDKAREDIKEEISYLEENVSECLDVIESASAVVGMICEVTEDDIRLDNEDSEHGIAYYYNGEDLPKEKRKYANGNEYECSRMIWNNDVYCRIIADY